jgi:hypothetical protein
LQDADSASACCVAEASSDATAKIEISNVKYVAHIVEMARDFYDMLRNLQAQSGGSLMIGSSTYRHFSHTMTVPDTAVGTIGTAVGCMVGCGRHEYNSTRVQCICVRIINKFSIYLGMSIDIKSYMPYEVLKFSRSHWRKAFDDGIPDLGIVNHSVA